MSNRVKRPNGVEFVGFRTLEGDTVFAAKVSATYKETGEILGAYGLRRIRYLSALREIARNESFREFAQGESAWLAGRGHDTYPYGAARLFAFGESAYDGSVADSDPNHTGYHWLGNSPFMLSIAPDSELEKNGGIRFQLRGDRDVSENASMVIGVRSVARYVYNSFRREIAAPALERLLRGHGDSEA